MVPEEMPPDHGRSDGWEGINDRVCPVEALLRSLAKLDDRLLLLEVIRRRDLF